MYTGLIRLSLSFKLERSGPVEEKDTITSECTYNNNFTSGLVRQYKNNQAQLIGQTESILTCDPNTFYRTLLDVEKQFKYKLFG